MDKNTKIKIEGIPIDYTEKVGYHGGIGLVLINKKSRIPVHFGGLKFLWL